jgi:hypothetical protein
MYARRSLVWFMIGSVSADLYLQAKWLPADDPDALTAAIFLLLALSGAFQLAFGLARLANVVKFIPTPVMAGFPLRSSSCSRRYTSCSGCRRGRRSRSGRPRSPRPGR